MEFVIDVVQSGAGGDEWTVKVLDAGGQPVLDSKTSAPLLRTLQERQTTSFIVPVSYPGLLTADADALGAAPHVGLCRDADAVANAHKAIVAPDGLIEPDVKTFGQFLFELLLGQAWWHELHGRAGAGPIELSLRWASNALPFQRLPWEMMHNGKRFLGQEGQFALVRRVTGTSQALRGIASPPRVLFVVGTELHNDVIRPGAEYLRLLQGLRVAGLSLSLQTRLLLRTTPDRLTTALDEFRPDVVHFICHGRFDDTGSCSLELVDQNDKSQPWKVEPAALALVLNDKDRKPPIVVLSACYTATQNLPVVGQVAAPFAAQLVEHGVPIAVGMGGRVTDQACRLFTRRFYEALLTTGSFAHATAEGRRAAIRDGGTDPERSSDWTMPTIFLSAGVQGTSATITRQAILEGWHNVAAQYSPGPFPVFCDRVEIVEKLDIVLSGSASQRAASQGTDLQALAIASRHPDSSEQYGRTWLLKELAAKAARDGHVPVMIERKEVLTTTDWPKTGAQLGEFIFAATRNTLNRFRTELGLPAALCPLMPVLRQVLDAKGQPLPPMLPQDVRDAAGDLNAALAAALRLDFRDLLAAARQKRPPGTGQDSKIVLLIDDLHRMGKEAVDTLKVLCGTEGLRSARFDVRLVFVYSSTGPAEQMPTINAITDWLSQSAWVYSMDLDGFKTPHEDREAYDYFLLNWVDGAKPRPLVPSTSDGKLAERVYRSLCKMVAGIPSRLRLKGVDVVETLLEVQDESQVMLQPADDEAALARSQQFLRGNP